MFFQATACTLMLAWVWVFGAKFSHQHHTHSTVANTSHTCTASAQNLVGLGADLDSDHGDTLCCICEFFFSEHAMPESIALEAVVLPYKGMYGEALVADVSLLPTFSYSLRAPPCNAPSQEV